MKRDELNDKFSKLNPANHADMDSFFETVKDKARETTYAAVTLWTEPESKMSAKAASLLADIDDLAIVPLLDAPELTDVSQRVWLLETVVAAQLELRDKIVTKLEKMLDDKSMVPLPKDTGPVEEPPPPRRVCDEAYVLMRRLVNFDEGKTTHYMNVEAFLNLPNAKKDVEIRKARESRTWTQLVENVE
jgi:hypothetical protein